MIFALERCCEEFLLLEGSAVGRDRRSFVGDLVRIGTGSEGHGTTFRASGIFHRV